MSFKTGFNQITIFLRKTVGLFLAAFLCLELILGWTALANPILADKSPGILHILKRSLWFIISLIFPILRFALTLPIASRGYFSWNFWKGYPASPQKSNSKQSTIIAMVISFSISLYIVLFSAYLSYTNLQDLSRINAFMVRSFDCFLAFSVPSVCTLFYSLQFFSKNIALTWVINILLLIFPIGTVLYHIFIWLIAAVVTFIYRT